MSVRRIMVHLEQASVWLLSNVNARNKRFLNFKRFFQSLQAVSRLPTRSNLHIDFAYNEIENELSYVCLVRFFSVFRVSSLIKIAA